MIATPAGLQLLHVCDSLFPIGSYGYSDGLEAATAQRLLSTADGLRGWLDAVLAESLARTDGPGFVAAFDAIRIRDLDAMMAVDRELTALRAASAMRAGSRLMGLRLLKTWHALHPDATIQNALAVAASGNGFGPTLPVAFALICAAAGVSAKDGLAALAYTRLASAVSAAMRLMPLGQTDAHTLLARMLDRVPEMVDDVLARRAAPEVFSPAMDIAQMQHPHLHSRLFRS
jgi:urease accessory protein